MTYAPLVKYIAYRKVRELPASCQVEDFISCGLEALITAIDRYDPEKGATLEQFAWTRIHGAILDELRRQDWAPRSAAPLGARHRDGTRAASPRVHGRRPPDEELADSLATTVDDLRTREQRSPPPSSRRSTRSSRARTTRRRARRHAGPEDVATDPEHATAKATPRTSFRRAFEPLPQREREIAVLLYVKNMTLREVGEILGVSESRVCQIHSQLKRRCASSWGRRRCCSQKSPEAAYDSLRVPRELAPGDGVDPVAHLEQIRSPEPLVLELLVVAVVELAAVEFDDHLLVDPERRRRCKRLQQH